MGEWKIDFVIKNGDTIYHHNFQYTLKYNYKLNAPLNDKLDSAMVKDLAEIKYERTAKLWWDFKDSTYETSAMRSGGRGELEKTDFGVFYVSNDTIYMVNKTRNNYKSQLLINEKGRYLYLNDTMPDVNVYIQYRKTEIK